MDSLTGENLSAVGVATGIVCESAGPYSYTVSGTAYGPYPGTFTETGSGTVTNSGGHVLTLSASFTIHSGGFLITGTKNGGIGSGCQDSLGNTGGVIDGLSYQATIHTPTGDYADRGTSRAVLFTNASTTVLEESFTSSLTAPAPIGPTSKDQCKNGGWKGFPQFKNQGQCVSFVESKRGT